MTPAAAFRAFDGRPPPYLLRGMRITAAGGPVIIAKLEQGAREIQHAQDMALISAGLSGPTAGGVRCVPEPQDGRDPLAGPPIPPEPISPALPLSLQTSATVLEPSPADLARLKSDVEALGVRLEDARNGIGAGGLALSVQLRRLHERYRIQPFSLPMPLGPPIEAKSIKIRGYAATADVDLDRSRILPTAWPALDPAKIKLLMSHDFNREVGTVDLIEVDQLGRVVIVATITDPFAMRMPGLSISPSIERFAIRNPDSQDFVGEIERVSDVNEISLTSTPSNRNCLVLERTIPNPIDLSYEAMINQVKQMQETARRLMVA